MSSYDCTYCSFTTVWIFSHHHHILRHNIFISNNTQCSNPVQLFKCTACEFHASRRDIVRKHQRIACYESSHRNAAFNQISQEQWHPKDRDELRFRFFCDKCSFKTKQKRCLSTHIKLHHSDPAHIKWYQCDKCPYKDKWKGNLHTHVLSKHSDPLNVTWYKCTECAYKHTVKRNLKMHFTFNHSDPCQLKWYKCDYCPYMSKFKNVLNRHVLGKHTDASDTRAVCQCVHCPFKTKYKSSFTRHMAQHSDREEDPSKVKWYTCEICSHKCRKNGNLKRHIMIKHITDPSKIKWYECDVCPYRSKWNKLLKKHKAKKHTDEKPGHTC